MDLTSDASMGSLPPLPAPVTVSPALLRVAPSPSPSLPASMAVSAGSF